MSINPEYTPLFEPYTFSAGDITLRNRLVLAPLMIYASTPDGMITPSELEFLSRRAVGVGMVMTAPCSVIAHGRASLGEWSCATDETIQSLNQAAEAIHKGGAMAVLQLHHAGAFAPTSLIGHLPLAPSAVAPRKNDGASSGGAVMSDDTLEISERQIEETIKAFGEGARRAVLAGFDGVEVHGASGSILQQFFSPAWNHRTDQWGGSIENRAAFLIAVLEEVQEVVRRSAYRPFSIGYRLTPEEASTPGITLQDTFELVEGLVACRPDWLHISTEDYFAGSIRNHRDPRPRANAIAGRVAGRTAVIAGGSITAPAQGAMVLSDGAHLVALGQALVIDPEWPQKVAAGEEDTLAGGGGPPCIPPQFSDADAMPL